MFYALINMYKHISKCHGMQDAVLISGILQDYRRDTSILTYSLLALDNGALLTLTKIPYGHGASLRQSEEQSAWSPCSASCLPLPPR